MTIIEQIKTEIDKRYAEYREKMKSDDFTYYEGMADALDFFEQFLDTLESEKPAPKDLEEAAEKHASMHPLCNGKPAKNSFIAGAKWGAKQILEHVKLAYGKVSMNPFDCSEAFEELINKINAL